MSLTDKVKEYFWATETEKFFNAQSALMEEFSVMEVVAKQGTMYLQSPRDLALPCRRLPNLFSGASLFLLGAGTLVGQAAEPGMYLALATLAISEMCRCYVMRTDYKAMREMLPTIKRYIAANLKYMNSVRQRKSAENDYYDGWLGLY